MTNNSIIKRPVEKKKMMIFFITALACMALFCMPVFASGGVQAKVDLSEVIGGIIDIIEKIFIAIGVILLAYAVGQLVLAFKNEDADSKSRATTMLVVSAVLITLPVLIDQLNLKARKGRMYGISKRISGPK